MEVGKPSEGSPLRGNSLTRRVAFYLAVVAFVALGLLLFAVYVNASVPFGYIGAVAALLMGIGAAAGAGAMIMGIVYVWMEYPRHRRAEVFLVAITLATLLAHVYIIGNPPASMTAAVSGHAGSNFGDNRVSATTSLKNNELSVTLNANGGSAIAGANVSYNGTPLGGRGFSPALSYSSPLEPSTTSAANWQLPTGSSNGTVTVSYQYLTCYATSSRDYGCIMDEVFYVPEGMIILDGGHCTSSTANCHLEHPWLVPALLAAGMAIFGEFSVVGWRVMPALLGTFSIPLLFGIAWKVSGSKKLASLSATLLAMDVMFFSQSSGGLLDIPEVFFALAGFFAYSANLKVWKLDKYVIAGVFFGVAGLAKETAVFILLGFLTYILFFDEANRFRRINGILKVALVVGLVFAGGLEAYDSVLTAPGYTAVNHIGYIVSYGSGLIAHTLLCQGAPTSASGYWCKFPGSSGNYEAILPTDWLIYYSPVAYYLTSVTVSSGGSSYSYVSIAYYGVTNLLETWTVFVWVPLTAYAVVQWFRRRRAPMGQEVPTAGVSNPAGVSDPVLEKEVRFAGFALTLFAWSYVPYLVLLLIGRVTYPFYFIPAIPAVAMGCSYWLSRSWFPKWLLAIYLGMAFVFFFVYFPDKAFLPDWLRVIIGH